MNTINISEGVNLHLIETDKFKTTTICLLIRRPLSRKEVTYNALLPPILRRGSKKYNTISKLNSHLEDMYGAVFDTQIVKIGEEQIIQFYVEILNKDIDKNLLDKSLKFLQEIIFSPLIENNGFKEDIINIEKENLKNNINGRVNNKAEYLKQKCIEITCKNEPFSIYGDGYIEDFDNITAENLYSHYNDILKTSPIEFIVIGKEEVKAAETIKELFNFERNNVIKIPKAEIIYKPKEIIEENEDRGLTQGKICISLRTGVNPVGQEFYNLLLMNEILGASSSSKLFINIREKESLCYNISSFIYRFKGIVMIQSGVDKENFNKTITLIEKEIKNMASGDISEEEISNAKKSLINNLNTIADYATATVNFYVSQYMLADKGNIEDAIEKVKNVSINDIQKCAEKMYIDTICTMS